MPCACREAASSKSAYGKLPTRRTCSDRITARSETILRMPSGRRATLLSSAPRVQPGELNAARIASDKAAYRSGFSVRLTTYHWRRNPNAGRLPAGSLRLRIGRAHSRESRQTSQVGS